MFDIGWSEIFIIAFLALILLGPKEIPVVLRTVTNLVRRLRGIAADFQQGMNKIIRETELDEIKKDLQKINPQQLSQDIKSTIDLPSFGTSPMDMFESEQKSSTVFETKNLSPAAVTNAGAEASLPNSQALTTNPPSAAKDPLEKGSVKTG